MTHKEIEEWVFNPKMPPNGYGVLVRPQQACQQIAAGFCHFRSVGGALGY